MTRRALGTNSNGLAELPSDSYIELEVTLELFQNQQFARQGHLKCSYEYVITGTRRSMVACMSYELGQH